MREILAADLIEAMNARCRFDGVEYRKLKGYRCAALARQPWLMPFQAPIQRSSSPTTEADTRFKAFTADAKAALDRSRQTYSENEQSAEWPRLRCSELSKALAKAASALAAEAKPTRPGLPLLHLRSGLQLRRVEIVADRPDEADQLLDLTNADLPFSLRLIGCVVRVPLALSNLKLVTLELSGSALVGVDASFLRTRGSVRLRRCFSNAPLDFGGAQVHGYFDAREALLQPFGALPAGQMVDGERGMLNLSQASIDNEVRLGRAIIWGGLTMRGLKTQRSIALDDADILSPLGVLEAMLLFQTQKHGVSIEQQPTSTFEPKEGHLKLRFELRDRALSENFKALSSSWGATGQTTTCLHVLMTERMRIRTSALRADGLDAAGSIFARGLMAVGRVRFKYANVAGGLSMQGASLSSAERQRANFNIAEDASLPEKSPVWGLTYYRANTYGNLVNETQRNKDQVAFGSDDFALDLRESRFGGTVRIGTPPEEVRGNQGPTTEIDGIVALERARIGGDLIFDRVNFRWTCRVQEKGPALSRYQDRYRKAEDERNTRVEKGEIFAVEARSIITDGHVTFRNSEGLNGIDLDNATIGGDVAFFEDMKRSEKPDQLDLIDPSSEVKGRIALAGARINGDCKVIFDRNDGAHLKAERVEVAGALVISARPVAEEAQAISDGESTPSEGASTPEKIHPSFPITASSKEFDSTPNALLKEYREAAAKEYQEFEVMQNRQRKKPMIDLGNASTSFFHHPPAAWPLAGNLLVIGFKYRRALDYGPLGPPLPKTSDENRSLTRRLLYIPKFYLPGILTIFPLSALLHCLSAPSAVSEWLFPVSYIYAALFFNVILKKFAYFWLPDPTKTRPLAVDWLDLQIVKRNAFRTSRTLCSHLQFPFLSSAKPEGNTYHSLNPYVIATQALREEGRWISANFVEQKRIEVRDAQLSWRLHFLQKALSGVLKISSQHGFNLARPIKLMGLLVLFAALLVNAADRHSAIKSRDDKAQCAPVHLTMASKLEFAMELVVPGVGVGQESKWVMDETKTPFVPRFAGMTYQALAFVLHVLGLFITSLLLIALSTRLAAVFGNYRD